MKKINVGFVGLGLMGLPMAKNILKKKHTLIVWSRSKKNYKDIRKLGATTCQNLIDLPDKCQIIIMMLIDDKICMQIASSFLSAVGASAGPLYATALMRGGVAIKDKMYTFYWDGSEQSAKLQKKEMNEFIRYKWIDDDSSEGYFEFLIQIDEMTQDVALIVTDFAEDEDEKEEQTNLWRNQIDQLKRAIGS